eukprot:s3491_g9.t1
MDFAFSVSHDGPYRGLPKYEECLHQVASRSGRTTVVAKVVMTDENGGAGTVCKSVIMGQTFHLRAQLKPTTIAVTILNGRVSYHRGPVFLQDDQCVILEHQMRDSKNLLQLVEACAGLGGIGIGATAAGWKVMAQNELMSSFCEHQRKHSDVPVVEGSICHAKTVAALHRLAPDAACFGMGFSCQPFSRAGDNLQGVDERSATLPYGLYASFLLCMDLTILECVAEAASSPYVQRCLEYHQKMVPGDRSETLLELADVWPAKRRRWWTVLSRGHFGHVQLFPLPKLPQSPTISGLVSEFLQLPEHELDQLILTEVERAAFHHYGKGIISQMVDKNGPMCTALHSWGNQCQDCACGCRKAFSHHRLQEHGLHGALVHVQGQEPHRNLRHISPKEMALFCGVPLEKGWDSPQRLLMAGLGQVASPIQASWIFAHIRAHLGDMKYGGFSQELPRQILACVCMDLFALRDKWCGKYMSVSMHMFQEAIEDLLSPERIPIDGETPAQVLSPITALSPVDPEVTEVDGVKKSNLSGTERTHPTSQAGSLSHACGTPFVTPSDHANIDGHPPVLSASVHASEAGPGFLHPASVDESKLHASVEGRLGLDHHQPEMSGGHPFPAPPLFQAMPLQRVSTVEGPSHDVEKVYVKPANGESAGFEPVRVDTTQLRTPETSIADEGISEAAAEFSKSLPCHAMPLPEALTVGSPAQAAMPLQRVSTVEGPSHDVTLKNDAQKASGDSTPLEPSHDAAMPLQRVSTVGRPSHDVQDARPMAKQDEIPGGPTPHQGDGNNEVKISSGASGSTSPLVPPTPFHAMPLQRASTVEGSSRCDEEKSAVCKGSKRSWIDAHTGGISAFSSKPAPPVSSPEPIDESPTAVSTTSRIQQLASDLLASKVIMADLYSLQPLAIAVEGDQTIADLKKAHMALHGTALHCYNNVGCLLSDESVVNTHAMILTSEHPWDFSADVLTKTTQMIGRPRHDNILWQGGAVASDEMRFYLQGLQQSGKAQIVPPLIVTDIDDAIVLAEAWRIEFSQYGQLPLASAVLFNGHWFPVVAVPCDGKLSWASTSGGIEIWPLLFPFDDLPLPLQKDLPSAFDQDCGFQTFAWIKTLVTASIPEPMFPEEACKWRTLFWQHLSFHHTPMNLEWVALGGQTELETAIAAILREHGVFPERVGERARHVIQQLGTTPLTHAINSARPWAAIKELANSQTPRLRLIQEDEFSKIAQSRTGKNQALATKKRMRHAPMPAVFTPADVAVPEGVFCQSNGTPLAQIAVRNISPSARGVVVLTEAEAQPFMSQKSMSKEGLALLILAPFSDSIAPHGESIRFPAQCTRSGEPVLLSALLIQKGQVSVQRMTPKQPMQVETVKSQTIKILAYRDQIEGSWDDFAERPIRGLLEALPCLKVCKQLECKCASWHPTDASSEPILDIWQRDFLSSHFKKVKSKEASIFSCMMRVTAEAFAIVSPLSGVAGLYIEARAPDGKTQDVNFHTVWLSKSTWETARAFQTTVQCDSALVRVSNRFGVRVTTDNAKMVHDMIRPEVPFLGGSAKTTWVVGPIPFGTTRKGLVKLFQGWEWEAKPLQPAGPAADKSGLKWQVVSTQPPPNYVYTLAHGDVLIVKAEPNELKAHAFAQVEASASTCKAVSHAAMSNADLIGDPWAHAASQLPKQNGAGPSASVAQIAALEATIEQRVLKKIHDEQPDADMNTDYEPRISALENQLAKVCKEQQSLANQQGVLSKQVEHIGHQMDSQTAKLQHHLDDRLNDQMQRIEALLSKRSRQE